MASAVFRSKAVVLLWSIRCLLLLPLFMSLFVYGPCFVLQYSGYALSNFAIISLERAGCFNFVVF